MFARPQDALPTTLAADESSGGSSTKITFERVIVFPDGHREIEGSDAKAAAGAIACISRKQRSVDLCGKTLAKFRKRRLIK
jgi:hypothetical protein